ncbi:hypothetical protein D9757_006510 [Collybiopsis confluens]|uniref:Uncharacterized protein n=1 Tax=Collybiopsis confluens TaxID=2823264 RepID=A0A8H5HQT3_9AGAR|nr:hypothetical protein D9757_006510 [Collybiopsis confluens]
MTPSLKATLTTLALAACVAAAPSRMASRQVLSGHGTLSAPTSGLVVAQGSSFPFAFQDSNWCEDGYSTITVWLTENAPTASSLNGTTGQLLDGQFIHYFGQYLIPNFGLPALSGTTPPPSTLVLPTLSSDVTTGDEIYLAVVETGTNCPPGLHVPPQYEITSLPVVIG